jgi:hypothetical protein
MRDFILKHSTAFMLTTAALTLLTLTLQLQTGQCLITDATPDGILSLEFAWDQEFATSLREGWSQPCKRPGPLCEGVAEQNPIVTSARVNIKWDFAFITAYFSLLVVLIFLHEKKYARVRRQPATLLMVILCSAGAALDVVENILMLTFLQGANVNSWWIAATATLKFFFLSVVLLYIAWRGAYLKRLSDFTVTLTHILWNNRVSVIGLLVLYFALWKSDQGQDLLINLNASHWGPITFYIVLSILATFYWYWPKYFSAPKWHDPSKVNVNLHSLFFGNWESTKDGREAAYVPRLLGVLTFVIPACGILRALDIFEISYPFNFVDPFYFLLVSIVGFILIMENQVLEKFFASAPRSYLGTIGALLILVLGLGFFNKYSADQLGLLSLGLYAIAFLFLMVTSIRANDELYRLTIPWMKRVKANTLTLLFVSVAALLFFGFNCYPHITADGPYRFITLPVVLTAIAFYSFIFFLLMIWGKKKGINFSAFLIVFGILIGVVIDNRYHDVVAVERNMRQLPSLSAYMHSWVLSRKKQILESQDIYPVFVVNAYGGGIRAAAWTTLAVSVLDSVTNYEFQDHVIAYSGASGGTIGSSILCAVRRNEAMDSLRTVDVKRLYEHDFLTPVLIGLFGRDVWFSTLGISWFDDRARLQEKIWEDHAATKTGPHYATEFSSIWYPEGSPDYKIPLLFSNTFHVEKGLKGILAPVSLDTAQFESAVVLNNLLKEKSVRYSTGAFLSARFPFISPAGKIDDKHHFLDGGLKENSGAETAEEIYRSFQQLANTFHGGNRCDSLRSIPVDTLEILYNKIRIYFLSLNNSIAATDEPGPSRNLVELIAPFQALYNNWVGNTAKADSVLRLRHRESYFELRPTATCVGGIKPTLPLGWQISDNALSAMVQSLKEPCGRNFVTIKCIEKIIKNSAAVENCKPCSSPSTTSQ